MKRFLLFTLVVGLFAVQAEAGMFRLDAPTARTFTTYFNPGFAGNVLKIVIDSPGTFGATEHFVDAGYVDPDGAGADRYGELSTGGMAYAVGFAGSMVGFDPGNVLFIGVAGVLGGFDSLGIDISNDDDDLYRYTAWVDDGAAITSGPSVDLIGGQTGFASVFFGAGSGVLTPIVAFGFSIDLLSPGTDAFHTSLVPVPGAVWLGMLGLSAAGLRLRKKRA